MDMDSGPGPAVRLHALLTRPVNLEHLDLLRYYRRHQIPSFAFNSPNNKFRREVPPPAPIITMNSSKQPVKLESITTAPQGVWTTPTSQGIETTTGNDSRGLLVLHGGGIRRSASVGHIVFPDAADAERYHVFEASVGSPRLLPGHDNGEQ